MQPNAHDKQRLTVVIGLGKTGLACARYLHAAGVPVAVTDSRANPPELEAARRELPGVELRLGGFDEALLAAADEVVISPGVSLNEPAFAAALARGVPFVSEIELFARAAKSPVIAITGSNGKSTVTTLVGLMAERAGLDVGVGGNLGTPALELLRQPEPDLYVLELSSFQLETTESLRPLAAVVLNISADHMDRYSSLEDYAAAKERIYRRAEVAVVNADDPMVMAMALNPNAMVTFSVAGAQSEGFGVVERDGVQWIARNGQTLAAAAEVRIPGRHNLANALAALALGEAAGLPLHAMAEVLREFPGLPHRTQWVGAADGITWYDDSKGTNVGATLAAVQGMSSPVVLIAGGDGKGQDFSPLRAALRDKARAVVLIGRDAPLIEQSLAGVVPTVRASDMDDAVRQCRALAQAGDVVLLSPACASFDMFKGYSHRGDVFREAVRRWAL